MIPGCASAQPRGRALHEGGALPSPGALVIADNPFFVLECSPDDSRQELERKAQLLLGMLELGFEQAKSYPSPSGPQPRTSDTVRAAVAALRVPERRLIAELWARGAPAHSDQSATPPPPRPVATVPGARRKLGWR